MASVDTRGAKQVTDKEKAEQLLELIEQNEPLGRGATEVRIQKLSNTYSTEYRQIIGVDPHKRRGFQTALKQFINEENPDNSLDLIIEQYS